MSITPTFVAVLKSAAFARLSGAGRVVGFAREHLREKLAAFFYSETCDPGDGQVIASLVPATRQRWLDEHPLPAHVSYFSLAAFTTGEHLSQGLHATWRILAEDDRRNDGQLLIADAVIPGATLLGYVNADHWDIAIPIDRQMPHLAARRSPREFPRPVLLDAMLRYVTESLEPAVRPLL